MRIGQRVIICSGCAHTQDNVVALPGTRATGVCLYCRTQDPGRFPQCPSCRYMADQRPGGGCKQYSWHCSKNYTTDGITHRTSEENTTMCKCPCDTKILKQDPSVSRLDVTIRIPATRTPEAIVLAVRAALPPNTKVAYGVEIALPEDAKRLLDDEAEMKP